MNKACCCDEVYESVETTTNLLPRAFGELKPGRLFGGNSNHLARHTKPVAVSSGSVRALGARRSTMRGLAICCPTRFRSRCRLRIKLPDHLREAGLTSQAPSSV